MFYAVRAFFFLLNALLNQGFYMAMSSHSFKNICSRFFASYFGFRISSIRVSTGPDMNNVMLGSVCIFIKIVKPQTSQ